MGNLEDKKAKGPVQRDKTAVEANQGRKRPIRVTRDLLVNKGPLVVPLSFKKPGMVNHWMVETPYSFERYYNLGYDYATNDKGDKCVVGKADGEVNILLEIPQDIYDEVKALKAEIKAERTAEINGIKSPRQQGQIEGIFEEKLSIK